MPRSLPRVSPLQTRKDLLIAESELNRAQLTREWEAATDWHRRLTAGARTIGSLASVTSLLVSGMRAFRHKRDAQNGTNASWLQPFLQAAGLIASLCKTFRSRDGHEKDK